MVIFLCKKCGEQHSVPNEWAGKTMTCSCGEKNQVPSPPKIEPDSEAALEEKPDDEGSDFVIEEVETLPVISSVSRVNRRRPVPWWIPVLKYLSSVVVAVLILFVYQRYVRKQPFWFFSGGQMDKKEEACSPSQNRVPSRPYRQSRKPPRMVPGTNPAVEKIYEPNTSGLSTPSTIRQEPTLKPKEPKTVAVPKKSPKKPEQPNRYTIEPASRSTTEVEETAKKLPVPADSELVASRKVVDEVFKNRIQDTWRDPEARSVVIAEILATASTTKKPAQKYALFQRAQELAVKAREVQLCFQVIKAMAQDFQIDPGQRWAAVLEKFAGKADEAMLKRLAEADLAASRDMAKRVVAADAWYEFSKTGSLSHRKMAKERAALHYRAALPLLRGAQRQQAQKRLQECQ